MAYWLGRNRLYLQVTNRVPSGVTTLFHARGPGFRLPAPFAPIAKKLDEFELAQLVNDAYEHDERKVVGAGTGMGEGDEGVVFAGTGEALLRLDTILRASELIKEARHGVPLILNTTGLGVDSADYAGVVTRLVESGVDRVSLFLPSADPGEYAQYMGGQSLGRPCEFLGLCVEQGLTCRVVTVDNGRVNVKQVRDLGLALGAVEFEAKKYVS